MWGFEINGKHTAQDYGLGCTGYTFPAAVPRIKTLKVEGLSGVVDYTESGGRAIAYDNRTLTAKFDKICKTHAEYIALQDRLYADLLGVQCEIKADGQTGTHWAGRCTGITPDFDGAVCTFTLVFSVGPYRMADNVTEVYTNVNGITPITLENGMKPVAISWEVTGTVTATMRGETYTLRTGIDIPELYLAPGDNVITYGGSGTVKASYRKGWL